MNGTLDDADRRLGDAVEAIRGINRDELPDGLGDDVREAALAVLAAKGRIEVEHYEVSAE